MQREEPLNGPDVALNIGSRALEILIVLVERAGEVVSKTELMTRVWPDVTVDDVSLRVHIAALRKALADDDPTQGTWQR